MILYATLFIAGVLTILLPCILPLIPIVLGVSIAGRSPWRPLFTVLGMVASFVGFTFLLFVVLDQFVEAADYLRIATYAALYLFGIGFLIHRRSLSLPLAAIAGLFFLKKGYVPAGIAAAISVLFMFIGAAVATRIQQFGSQVQQKTREELGEAHPATAFVIGLTMGLVWVPCAGPALGFAFALVREEPGLRAFFALTAYGLGTALPLMLIGYGGQIAIRSVRTLNRYTGLIKQIAGVILVITSLLFASNLFREIEIYFVNNTPFGNLGVDIEQRLFGEDISPMVEPSSPSSTNMRLPQLPIIMEAPEFAGLGPWHNSEPFTMESLRGKVVLVDFWTYSCINCIRTLPYIQGYWDKFKDQPFVLIGVHTPEFVFEKSEQNVADAIERHSLTYPVAQDNDYQTWRAFSNRYWPAKYLIDADGYVRYTHFGEGAYDETDLAIQSLLAEIGAEVTGETVDVAASHSRRERSPETYLGSRSWSALANGAASPTNAVIQYEAPKSLDLHEYALDGEWQMVEKERQVLRSEQGEIRMQFVGDEINLVMGMEEGRSPANVQVVVDGEQVESFVINKNDLFPLWSGEYGEHEIVIRISGEGAEGYAFTFGS